MQCARTSFVIFTSLLCLLLLPAAAIAAADTDYSQLTLNQAIDLAIEANLGLKSSQAEVTAAHHQKDVYRAEFLPRFNANYRAQRNDEEVSVGSTITGLEEEYTFTAGLVQPLFTGFAITRQYEIAGLGLSSAQLGEQLTRQDVVLEAQRAYFNILRTKKFVKIGEEQVKNIAAQEEVADNFYQVGMSPLNDLLQAQASLANAKQLLVSARNNLDVAKAQLNTLLRRPVNMTVDVEDIEAYQSLSRDLDYFMAAAEQNRLEIQISQLNVDMGDKKVDLAKSSYYPTLNLEGGYFRYGTDWGVNGGTGIMDENADGWRVAAVVDWNFWQWGKTHYSVSEQRARLQQAQYDHSQLLDQIRLEVKTAYLKVRESEKNIATVETAIEQAKENLRINQEQFKEQVATTTNVLDAQTLLTRTMVNYFNALYDYKIAKAALYRATGLKDPQLELKN